MTREITPEEVREFAENVGWQHVTEAQICGVTCETDLWAKPDGSIPYSLPDFLSDLAACFEGLSHYSSDWDLRRRNGVVFECEVYRPSEEYSAVELTPQAAIIRAVNAAARARSKV